MIEETTSIAENEPLASEEQQQGAQEQGGDTADSKPELNDDGTPKEAEKPQEKPEKSEAEKERTRLLRALERNKRDKWEARQRAELLERQVAELTRPKIGVDSQSEADDSEKLTLTKAEMLRHIEEEAKKIAPTIAKQVATEEQLRSAVVALKRELGDEFDELTDELEDILPKGKSLMLLSAKNPASLVRYLADPDNADEAKALAGMSEFHAGIAIAELQMKLAQKKSEEKPKPSNAPKPLQPVRAEGRIENGPDPVKDPKGWRAWRNKMEFAARR